MKRNIYLKMQTLEAARRLFLETFAELQTGEKEIESRTACGRITSRPVAARLSAPSFHGAAMDGLAVLAEDTFEASDNTPVTLNIASGQAVPINTGHALPPGKNAVIMIEHVLVSDDQRQGVVRAPVYPWQHVRKAGEDIVATELIFPSNHLLKPADIGALLTAGCPRVWVRKAPEVTIMPTGSELVALTDPAQEIPPGKTVESNSAVLAAMARQVGAKVDVYPIIRDEYQTIKKRLEEAILSPADMVIMNAGSSAGNADFTARIIAELGRVLVHGITIMPGKPTILGVIGRKPVVGCPGYPVSAIIAFEQLVAPLLEQMQGRERDPAPRVTARMAKNLPSRGGIEEFRRMITGRINDHFVTMPVKKGAGSITTVTRANSILRIPAAGEGLAQNSAVEVELLRPLFEIDKTILCTGSHDLTLDIIHDFLKKSRPAYPLASTHVGSLGGIMAVKNGMTHIAGSHLLDPESGEYNLGSLRRYLKDQAVALITLAHREQGFMLRPGNPKKISGIADLLRDDVVFVNRQAGSGTRVLLDFELAGTGLNADEITGYDNEEYTHMAVAISVLSGKADTGLGIMAAARALHLDFIPLTEERYDLIIPVSFLDLPMIQKLLEIIEKSEFKQAVEALGGYSMRETGRRVL